MRLAGRRLRNKKGASYHIYLAVLPIDTPGGAEGTRTPDLLRAKEALSQLSYSPIISGIIATRRPVRNLLNIADVIKWGE